MKSKDLHISSALSELEEIKVIFAASEKRHQAEIKLLKEQIRFLTDKLFGRRSEKHVIDDKQLLLFEEKEDESYIPETIEPKIDVQPSARKKRGRKAIPADLPRIEVIHDLDEKDKVCECGCIKARCGEETSEQYDVVPPKYRVILHIRPKYACRACEGVESENPTVMIAPVSLALIPKSNATSGLIAQVIAHKFADALPFYRQSKIMARHGVIIPRSTLCNWTIRAADCCKVLLELLQKELLSGPLINIDETPTQVHNEPGRKNTSNSYMWVFCGGPPSAPVYIFSYDPTRAGQVPKDFLGDYTGYAQTDGYAGYNFLDTCKAIHHVGCMAHARRKFMEAAKVVVKPKDSKGMMTTADEAVLLIRKLYAIEKEAKVNGLDDEQKTALRRKKSKPVLDEFKTWLDEKSLITVPKSALGKAIAYTLSQWPRLIRYIDQGFVSPDNNRAENAIRPFVIGRKNWLFSNTPKGAESSAAFYSLIETAKANGLEPYHYLKYVFGKLPHARTTEDHKALLPQYLDREDMMTFCEGVVY